MEVVYQHLPDPPTKPLGIFRTISVYHGMPPLHLKHVLSLQLLNLSEDVSVYASINDETGDFIELGTLGSGTESANIDMGSSGGSVEWISLWCDKGERAKVRLILERYIPQWKYTVKEAPKSYDWRELYKPW